jgi:hypothetical protein
MYLRKGNATSTNYRAGRMGRGSGCKALKNSRTGSLELTVYCGVQGSVCELLPNDFRYDILMDTQLASERPFCRT